MIVAFSMVALMAAAAIGVDVGRLVYEREQLQNSLDAAAAAGVMKLPGDPVNAIKEAEKFARENMVAANLLPADTTWVPKIALRCVTSYNKSTKSPDWPTVLAVCGISSHTFDVLDCNELFCSVYCDPNPAKGFTCNTIVVKGSKQVDYMFGPAIQVDHGDTGAIVSAACRGYCGTVKPNPLNVVVMADRTPSMDSSALAAMKNGITSMLGAMNQEQQYVAFGALGISGTNSGAVTGKNKVVAAPDGGEGFSGADYATFNSQGKTTWSAQNKKWRFNGNWVPIKYTNKYQRTGAGGTVVMDTTTELGSAVSGLASSNKVGKFPAPWHLPLTGSSLSTSNWNKKAYDNYGQSIANYGNTHLASALKAAVRYALYTNPETAFGLPDRTKYGKVQKIVIFETDGSPVEVFNSDSTALSLTNDLDVGATDSSTSPQTVQQKACDNFLAIADAAKATKDVKLIMIGVGGANKAVCGSKTVPQTLAAAASPKDDGTPSDGIDCSIGSNADKENGDGDNYFCASDSTDLQRVFLAAFGSLNVKSTLMRLPNATTFA